LVLEFCVVQESPNKGHVRIFNTHIKRLKVNYEKKGYEKFIEFR